MRVLSSDGRRLIDDDVVYEARQYGFEEKIRLIAFKLGKNDRIVDLGDFESVNDIKQILKKMAYSNEPINIKEELECLIQ